MNSGLDSLSIDARRLYSKWSPEAWSALCDGPATELGRKLNGRADAEPLLRAYLTLAREAVGLQYIDRNAFDAAGRPSTFLASLWTEALPRLLPDAPAGDVGPLLERAWNAAERLASEPAWINRYLSARLPSLDRLARFEAWLRESLTPVLDTPPPSTWKGPLSFVVVDCAGGDGFLPGKVHLAAPVLACVHHRREEGRQVAFLLAKNGKSAALGRTPCLGEFAPTGDRPPRATFTQTGLKIARLELPLPRFGSEHGHVVAPAGFVVAVAKTSQRVWIVESP